MKPPFMFDSWPLIYRASMLGDPEATAAHLLRRTTLGPHADRISALAGRDHDTIVGRLLDQSDDHTPPASPEEWSDVVRWWLDRMTTSDTGLTDRLAWFWHGLLTTNAWKVDEPALIAAQLAHLRSDGRGDFRSLLHGFVTSGATLQYLDASRSLASKPNENLSRELMELFTIGPGPADAPHYSQDDVRAGARALAGWVVEDGQVEFRTENAFIAPLLFLGEQADWDTTMVIDRLCDHPATAQRISARLWSDLTAAELTPDGAIELGRWWQERDLAIDPLVERILSDSAFDAAPLGRPRSGLEWYCALRTATDLSDDQSWHLEGLGQMPYLPPSAAGWPTGPRWLEPGSLLARANVVHSIELAELVDLDASVDDILRSCGLPFVSEATRQALASVGTRIGQDDGATLSPEAAGLARWRLALTCPEFHLT